MPAAIGDYGKQRRTLLNGDEDRVNVWIPGKIIEDRLSEAILYLNFLYFYFAFFSTGAF
jgi:hypothetical protein